MDSAALRLLAKEGKTFEVSGKTPFLLSDPGTLWFVAEGKLDVFAVRLGADGRPAGHRRYLWSSEVEDGLIGVGEQEGFGYGLLAVGAGESKIVQVPMARVMALSRDASVRHEMAVPIRSFIRGVSRAVSSHEDPPIQALLGPNETHELKKGERAEPRDRCVWVKFEEGTALFAGMGDIPIGPDDGWLPMGKGLFVQAASDTLRFTTLDTETYMEKAPEGPMGRRALRHYFMLWVKTVLEEEDAVEAQRLAAKAEADRQMRRGSLLGLVGVLEKGVGEHEVESGGFPLLAACRAAGRVGEIEFRDPPKWEMEGGGIDPLASICRASRVRFRRVALRGAWWKSDVGGLLAFRGEEKAPVAILSVRKGKAYELFDPAAMTRTPLTPAVAASLDPFAVAFYRPLPDRILKGKDLAKSAFLDMKADLKTIVLMTLLGTVLGLLMPIANGQVFSSVIPSADPKQMWGIFAALFVAGIGGAMFDLTKAFALVRFEGRASNSLQAGVIDRLLTLPVPFFRQYAVGDLVQRTMSINTVRSQLSGAALTTVLSGVTSILNFVLLFWYAWKLALVAVGILLLIIVVMGISSWRMIIIDRVKSKIDMKVGGLLFQMIGGVAKLRVAGAEGRAFAVWARLFRDSKRLQYRAGHVQNVTEIFSDVMPILANLALFGVAGYLMQDPKNPMALNTGAFIAFNSAFGSFISSGAALANTAISLVNLIPVMENAKPILATLPETDLSKPDPGRLSGRIEGSHLSFRYQADGPLILDDVSFEADPGEFIAFVGPSGSGKSTALRMLLSFEKPETGAVYYDGQDLATVDVSSVRRQIGVVLQSSKLIAGSVYENIVGSAPLTQDDAWAAAEAAGFAEDVKQMPMAMHTMISEGGSTLSGGQRQRLLIARALVKKPRIVFFDEATSALDNRTQEIVSQSLDKMFATRVVIAHRLSTIRNANRIYVVDKGRVVQAGSYDELSAIEGMFKTLVSRQVA